MEGMKRAETSGVSVIICCYNSAVRLPETLNHLSRQVLKADLFLEILIVNNRSTDETKAVAQALRNAIINPAISLKILDEMQPGQMYARRTGVEAATYDTIVFCDDDNWLDPGYVQQAFELMQQNDQIGAAGGKIFPVTEVSPPHWFESYRTYYATGIPAAKTGDVSHKTYVLGAGMVTRKHLFLGMFTNQFPTLLPGRKGTELSTGDDFEYCKRLLLCGYRLYYHEQLSMQHFISAERLTVEYRERLMAGIDRAGAILDLYDRVIQVVYKTRTKSRWRLWLLAPLRVALARLGWSRRNYEDEKLVGWFVSPLNRDQTNPLSQIKRFYYAKKGRL